MVTEGCWEQRAFRWISTPFLWVFAFIHEALQPIYKIIISMKLSFILLVFVVALSLVWLVLLNTISMIAWIARGINILRPVLFITALPLLIVASFINFIPPTLSHTDFSAMREKFRFINSYPICKFD